MLEGLISLAMADRKAARAARGPGRPDGSGIYNMYIIYSIYIYVYICIYMYMQMLIN